MPVCKDNYECNREIDAYIQHPTGFPLLIGIDDAADYEQILYYAEIDNEKKIIKTSDYCRPDSYVNPLFLINDVSAKADAPVVWIGATQATMLISETQTRNFLQKLVDTSIHGSLIVLCPFCCGYLELLASKFVKLGQRIILLHGKERKLPSIEFYNADAICTSEDFVKGNRELLCELEVLKKIHPIPFMCLSNEELFAESVFPVTKGASAYQAICKQMPTAHTYLSESDGTAENWKRLLEQCSDGFTVLCTRTLGSISQLSTSFVDFFGKDEFAKFLCFVALKIYYSNGNGYLNVCVQNSHSMDELADDLYDRILSVDFQDEHFSAWMKERRRILQFMDENVSKLRDYCTHATIHGKNVLFYLCEDSEEERAAIIHALCVYDYAPDELTQILKSVAPKLSSYLSRFVFDELNTKVLDDSDRTHAFLTKYFSDYKLQKVTNHQDVHFIKCVEEEALKRTFTKLPARSMLVKKMDKSNVQPYFFDALGVEFLAFIADKCEEYQMLMDVQICRCNLPSITCKNKEFESMFPEGSLRKEEGLDEIKHRGTKYDFQTTKEPLHIYDELILLEARLKRFASILAREETEKVVILSDHGASRLAVTYQSENEKLSLSEKGQHSGRCCPVTEDPHIAYATYEDGFAVLANYERFAGSRKADVETHGGATLEETLVPIITLTARSKTQKVEFVDEEIMCNLKDGSTIELFANPPLSHPRLVVGQNSYQGHFVGDKHLAQFVMPDIKRKGQYIAEVYDGNKKVATLSFTTKRKTGSTDNLLG